MQQYQLWKNTNQLEFYAPYEKQVMMHNAGKGKRQRLFLAGNRCGKTYSASMETAIHLTGKYPKDWKGLRFDGPINAWSASVTTEATRDILQHTYLGDINNNDAASADPGRGIRPFGCGTIPRDDIVDFVKRRGTPDAVDVVKVQHYNSKGEPDGISTLGFKAYDQGREKFQGTARHWIHLDEEPPWAIFEECLMRLAGTGINGSLLLSMTPLMGMTEVCEAFLDNKAQNRVVIQMEWSEAAHLSDQEKQELLAGIPLYQQEAREKGIPVLGSGKIYPIEERLIECEPFAIPGHYKRIFAMDFGWSAPTAVLFGAIDPNTETMYLYDEYYVAEKQPGDHATALYAKDVRWIPGVCDPAGQGTSINDGQKTIELYQNLGFDLMAADNSKEIGIQQVLMDLHNGKIKVFKSLQNFWKEFRRYSRDEKGRIKDESDHLMDCLRYMTVSGRTYARSRERIGDYRDVRSYNTTSWTTL